MAENLKIWKYQNSMLQKWHRMQKNFQNLNGYDSFIPSTPYVLKGAWKGGYLLWDHSFMPTLMPK